MKTNIKNTLGKASLTLLKLGFTRCKNSSKLGSHSFAQVFIFALSSFLFISCDQQEVESFDSQKDTPISIASAGVAELTTRAIIEGQLIGAVDENATMSVFVTGGSADKYNADNVEWIHDGTDWWSADSPTLFEGANSKQKICALSPYVDGASAEGVTITADGTTDYLVASQTLITSNPVNIVMSHALAMLVLNPTLGTEVAGDNIATVEVQNMYTQGTFNVEENSWSDQGEATATFSMNKVNGNYEVLVIPMEECQSFPMVITMSSGRAFSANISLANVGNKLEGGTQYTIKLQIGHDTVTIGDISAASWGTPVEGGDLETL